MKRIELTSGYFAAVDDSDYERINLFEWCSKPHGKTVYAIRSIKIDRNRRTTVYMHHLVMGFPLNNLEIDHIDGNSLNNTKSNLRFVTRKDQTRNKIRHRNGRTVGVIWDKSRNKWQLRKDGKLVGRFSNEKEACRILKEIS